jgi:23S rRNA (guanosine2251-2'-O)-methyltransferase
VALNTSFEGHMVPLYLGWTMVKREILYGIHPVLEALRSGKRDFFTIFLATGRMSERMKNIMAEAELLRIPIQRIPPEKLGKMAGSDSHQGVGAEVSLFSETSLSDILTLFSSNKKGGFVLLLDGVVDPHNLGALIRTALCAGSGGIIIPKDRSAGPTAAVSKASAGALEHVCLGRVTNISSTITVLKEAGFWVTGLDRAADHSVFSSELSGPVVLVIGGEERGIRTLVKKQCDYLVSIPQTGPVDSLNASVAGSVVMYEIFRQQQEDRLG